MDTAAKLTFIKAYLASRRLIFGLLLGFLAVVLTFSLIFEDSGNELRYLLLLLGFLAAVFITADCASSYREYRRQTYYGSGQAKSPLEILLKDRLDQLEEEQKNQQTIELDKYNDLLDYYTLWAHQIKTPIAASSLLVGDLTDQTAKKQLEQEIFKIESYVNLVLQYLRLESFHEDLVLHKERLDDLVKEMVKKYAIFFIQKGLSLDLHDLDREVLTDKKWFLVILEQILSNSLKYTQQGGIEIYCQDQTLYIKDTGLGIQNADILRVFERGFSGYNGRLTQQSSGLGLYLSKKIADQLGHDIAIESQVGQGTTVKITFKEQRLVIE